MDSCPECSSEIVSQSLEGTLHWCEQCHLSLINCPNCKVYLSANSQFCVQCGESCNADKKVIFPIDKSTEGVSFDATPFLTFIMRGFSLSSQKKGDEMKDAIALVYLCGMLFVWEKNSGQLWSVTPHLSESRPVFPKESLTANAFGPPVGFVPFGTMMETGRYLSQVGPNMATVLNTSLLTNARWNGGKRDIHQGNAIQQWLTLSPEELGLDKFLNYFSFLDEKRLVVTGLSKDDKKPLLKILKLGSEHQKNSKKVVAREIYSCILSKEDQKPLRGDLFPVRSHQTPGLFLASGNKAWLLNDFQNGQDSLRELKLEGKNRHDLEIISKYSQTHRCLYVFSQYKNSPMKPIDYQLEHWTIPHGSGNQIETRLVASPGVGWTRAKSTIINHPDTPIIATDKRGNHYVYSTISQTAIASVLKPKWVAGHVGTIIGPYFVGLLAVTQGQHKHLLACAVPTKISADSDYGSSTVMMGEMSQQKYSISTIETLTGVYFLHFHKNTFMVSGYRIIRKG